MPPDVRRAPATPWRSSEYSDILLVNRDEDAVPDLALDGLGEMALAGGVLHEDHLAGGDGARLAVARRDLHAGVQVDDVLSARRGVPVQIVGRRDFPEDDPRGGQVLGQL